MMNSSRFFSLFVTALVGAFLAITVALIREFNNAQPHPYMDEQFHVPQTQLFCSGNFTYWDPMITTLPGLYGFSFGLLKPLEILFSSGDGNICSTALLRGVNVVFNIGNLWVIYQLCVLLYHNQWMISRTSCLLKALTLVSFPVLYFFTFLYYTDAGSTFFVLYAYLLSQHHHHYKAATVATIAVLFRQTNVVWIAFMAGSAALNHLSLLLFNSGKKYENVTVSSSTLLEALNEKFRKDYISVIRIFVSVLVHVLPYALALFGFVLFVYINGSIVVGAKSDHQAVVNVPQVLYYLSFVGLFGVSHFLSSSVISDVLHTLRKHFILVIILLAFGCVAVFKLTYVHRYLLADNRHYPFYIWGRILGKYSISRYALVPVSLLVAFAMTSIIMRSKNSLWVLLYFLCVAVNLIPSPLLEFRYFIVPYLLFRIHSVDRSAARLLLELLLYCVINAFTLFMFLYKPFKWPDSYEAQRFMW